jgi:hypothetical protein
VIERYTVNLEDEGERTAWILALQMAATHRPLGVARPGRPFMHFEIEAVSALIDEAWHAVDSTTRGLTTIDVRGRLLATAQVCAGTAERSVSKVHWGRVLAGGEAQDRAFGDILRDLEDALRGVARERREAAGAATAILSRSSRGTPEEGDEAV